MPPKRMSDILQSSSIDARITPTPLPTATTDTSNDPTLPLPGATSEHSTTLPANGTKRKRTTNQAPQPNKVATTSKTAPLREHTRTNHPSLYNPWLLLPPKQRKEIEAQGTDTVEVIVYGKNQSVKSGISRLLRLIGAAAAAAAAATGSSNGEEEKKVDGEDGGVVVLSAQGQGTVKLVGVFDMVRRIVGGAVQTPGSDGIRWYAYTVLSSVEMSRRRNTANDDGGDGQIEVEDEVGAMDVDGDEEGGAGKEAQCSGKEEVKTVPVLSVWMSRKKMVSWKEVFGEQEMVVYKTEG